MAMSSEDAKTPPQGIPLKTTPVARQLWDLGIALSGIAVDLSTLARATELNLDRVLEQAKKKVSDAEILVHDARRALRELTLRRGNIDE